MDTKRNLTYDVCGSAQRQEMRKKWSNNQYQEKKEKKEKEKPESMNPNDHQRQRAHHCPAAADSVGERAEPELPDHRADEGYAE